eukprot:1664456-Lingulodinium_polyedra.AAC.1
MPVPSKRDIRATAHGAPSAARGAWAGAGTLNAVGPRVASHPWRAMARNETQFSIASLGIPS